jgi:DNA-directed RNA polymerase specialized sigma subunit
MKSSKIRPVSPSVSIIPWSNALHFICVPGCLQASRPDDLIQAGMEGLIHAQRAFEPSRGIDFEMFAKTRIRGAMLDEVRRISYSTRSAISIKREQDQAISALSKEVWSCA